MTCVAASLRRPTKTDEKKADRLTANGFQMQKGGPHAARTSRHGARHPNLLETPHLRGAEGSRSCPKEASKNFLSAGRVQTSWEQGKGENVAGKDWGWEALLYQGLTRVSRLVQPVEEGDRPSEDTM